VPTLPPKLVPLARLGNPDHAGNRSYVDDLGLDEGDVDALVELAKRWIEVAHDANVAATDAMWAPLHACHALAELDAVIVVPTMLAMLDPLGPTDDDWTCEHFMAVCRRLGTAVLPVLVPYVLDAKNGQHSRTQAMLELAALAKRHPTTRPTVVAALAELVERMDPNTRELNGFTVGALAWLTAVEHAALIGRAFARGVVDHDTSGGWPYVRRELGLGQRRD